MTHRVRFIAIDLQVTDRQRRVSFDLAHNTVHILPSMKQIKHMIQMREKAEQEKQATNQEILDEPIIDEIEKELQACTCQDNDTDSSVLSSMSPEDSMCIKSCLKKTSAIKFETEQAFKTKGTKCSEQRKKNRRSKDFVSSNGRDIFVHTSDVVPAQMTSRHTLYSSLDPALVAKTISAH
ncbi:hypothetical protein INT43_001320 [Umbelopsis isabellina]|uniref:Uncharacterized protein n=1 Tax=Mortierella isabellina TaxID=91625 RepID=A0A8H7UD93_MORIS|nr:hypothetical protein INT43_001320 [Umbelopsis isabellina]